MMRFSLLAGLLLGVLASSSAAQDYVWLEGESPTKANVQFQSGGWGHPDYLSGGKWLFGSVEAKDLEAKVPADGAVLSYDFEAKAPATTRLGARRLRVRALAVLLAPRRRRLEGSRSRRADDRPDGPRPVGRGRLAEARARPPLPPANTLSRSSSSDKYRTTNGKKEPDRILFGLDCVCLYRGEFHPERPAQAGQRLAERRSTSAPRKHVFEVKSGGDGGERASRRWPATGRSPAATSRRSKDRAEPVKELPADLERAVLEGDPGARQPRRQAARPGIRPPLPLPHARQRAGRLQGPLVRPALPVHGLIASVFVNGKYCGGSKAPCAAWECDVTAAVKPGEVNEVVVAIKDRYYAIAQDGPRRRSARTCSTCRPTCVHDSGGLGFDALRRLPRRPPVSRRRHPRDADARRRRPAPTPSDVFAMPSVKKQGTRPGNHPAQPDRRSRSTVEIANEVVPHGRRHAARRRSPARQLTVAPGEEETTSSCSGEVGEPEAVVAGRPAAVRRRHRSSSSAARSST